MSDATSNFGPTAAGATLGAGGPQGGAIVRDEQADGARLVLEADSARDLYAITVSIEEWLVVPRFFATLAEAHRAFDGLRAPLWTLRQELPATRPPPGSQALLELGARVSAFVAEHG